MANNPIGPLLHSFFEDYLKLQNGLRPASIKSYSDTIRLFLTFVSNQQKQKITRLLISDFSVKTVVGFLNFLEEKRFNHIRTRNNRLAALKTLFEYLGRRLPEVLAEAERISAIPIKRVAPPETYFLERDEIAALFSNLPKKGRYALRDHALLMFLYNTGARVQEIASLKVANLILKDHPCVHLHGKGDKWRVCPLWEKTVILLKQLIFEERIENKPEYPVFQAHTKRSLTRYGIYKIVRKHTQFLIKKKSDTSNLSISPHTFRHTTAVHMLEAGVEINVIRGWLGHVSLETTNRYAEINLRMKEAAMKLCEPPLNNSEEFPRKTIWRDDKTLLEWLQSL